MFSELAPVNGFYDGLLGLEVDMPAGRLILAPRIPPHWDHLAVEQMPVGSNRLSLEFERSLTEWNCCIQGSILEDLELMLRPELPAGSQVTSVEVDDCSWPFLVHTAAHSVIPELTIPRLRKGCRVRVRHHSGVAWMPIDPPLETGMISRNLRVIGTEWNGTAYRFSLEGRPGQSYPVRFYTDATHRAEHVTQGHLKEEYEDGFLLEFQAPDQAATNRAGFVQWQFDVQF
jgi:hypothetical protein